MSTEDNGKATREVRLKRLRYQSWHRGCKETDDLLGTYCDRQAQHMTEEEIGLFELFLEEDDYDIWHWIAYNKAPPQEEYRSLIKDIQQLNLTQVLS